MKVLKTIQVLTIKYFPKPIFFPNCIPPNYLNQQENFYQQIFKLTITILIDSTIIKREKVS